MSRPPRLLWRELHWARPLDDKRALAFVRQLAADPRSPLLALEARGTASGISYFLASPPAAARDADLVIHASGAPEGLEVALQVAAVEATIGRRRGHWWALRGLWQVC